MKTHEGLMGALLQALPDLEAEALPLLREVAWVGGDDWRVLDWEAPVTEQHPERSPIVHIIPVTPNEVQALRNQACWGKGGRRGMGVVVVASDGKVAEQARAMGYAHVLDAQAAMGR